MIAGCRQDDTRTRCPRRVGAHSFASRALSQLFLWGLALVPASALAHIDSASAGDGGFFSGLRHPVTGLDHVVAMVAVGLWGAQLGAPAMWLLPVVFPVVMAIGGVVGVIGVALPGVDLGIAISAVLLGVMVVAEANPSLWAAMVAVGVFAVFHGHAHGTALPAFGVPILFAAGFVVATGLLHLCGILFGLLVRWPAGRLAVRGAGIVVAIVGGYYLAAHLGLS